ncbi:glycosyltransferase family 57 protein [Paxillus involutus ATCC 200175]|uniref:Alpha-1,3-glucosyltransferase n=2 Tax=Paxillus involutus ATCC 200175 TaxID=664439 RepID=A0A0C9U6K9_PAXIN|nr:glycosyltransferase family 57 protein [Paxillus involutus ATCC 200175]
MDTVPENPQYAETRKRRARDRTASLNAAPHVGASHLRDSAHRHHSPMASIKTDDLETEPAQIVSPVPRRHLLTSESLHWLRLSELADDDGLARGVSPASAASSSASAFPSSSASKRLSFSALLEHERVARGIHTSASLQRDPLDDRIDQGAVRRWVRWMHKHNLKAWVVPSAIAASIWVKWCIGLGGYSGHATPPMFGDYEAQRHWMELTIHLPIQQWYTYDLRYWGLDYPPLTAYVSWICGRVGSWIDPSWFALETSRGIETPGNKLFMRATVLVLDALVFVPALYAFTRTWLSTRSSRTQHAALVTLLFHPALLLIDFGHFQYNSVMLGLTLLAIDAFAVGLDLVGAVFFVLSLGFKQMALYYAPVVGAYLLGKCIYLGPKNGTRLFIRLAFVTVLSFIVLFAPFLPPFAPISALGVSISRIFPFARGLFEDKVANFWCFTNVTVLKWKRVFNGKEALLIRASAALTALGFLPAVAGLLWGSCKTRLRSPSPSAKEQIDAPATPMTHLNSSTTPTPTLPLLPYALLTTSMSFFLFSFQVHEKTILLPLLPLALLLSGATPGEEVFAWGALGNVVGVFSMWPLLKKDGLGVQYLAMLLLWCRLIGYNPFAMRLRSFVGLLSTAVHISMGLLHLLELVIVPPTRYPDLFPVLNVLVSTPVFGLVWLWSIKRGIEVSWAMGGLTGSRADAKDKGKEKEQGGEWEKEKANGLSTVDPVPSLSRPGVRNDAGTRAKSLGFASGQDVSGGRGYRDPRRRALERLSMRAGGGEEGG